MKRRIYTICSILFFISMLIFPQAAFRGARSGLLLWFNTVLPTLLPFIIISNLLVHTSAIDMISRIISPFLCRFFGVTSYGAFVILTGFLCGCPMGSKVAADLLKKGALSRQEACYLLSFCNNTSPMFIISYVILQNLKMPEQTLPLLLIVMLTPVFLSFLFRRIYHIQAESFLWQRYGGRAAKRVPDVTAGSHTCAFARQKSRGVISSSKTMTLDACIMNGFETITRIGGYIILFSIIISYAKMIPSAPTFLTMFLLPSLELTSGITMICSGTFPEGTKLILALALTAFGGWCAAAQTRSMLQDTDIPIIPYIIEKLAAALATSLSAYCYLAFSL